MDLLETENQSWPCICIATVDQAVSNVAKDTTRLLSPPEARQVLLLLPVRNPVHGGGRCLSWILYATSDAGSRSLFPVFIDRSSDRTNSLLLCDADSTNICLVAAALRL